MDSVHAALGLYMLYALSRPKPDRVAKPGGLCSINGQGPLRVAILKQRILRAKTDHKTAILKEDTLKDAHVYCAYNGLSSQRYGPLLEHYIIVKHGFKRNLPDNRKGDCFKDDKNHEIKVSLGGESHNQFNFVQIRFAHDVDVYVFTALHVNADNVNRGGELYVFRLSKTDVARLVLEYGSYAHGTNNEHGMISAESLADSANVKEYALRVRYGTKRWNALMAFRISEADV